MTIIVRHKDDGSEYILLGAGFGAYKALRPSFFLGNLAPHEEAGELPVVLVCSADGLPRWVRSEKLEVLSVDGERPSDILGSDV